jgi:hypothetical protein
MAAIGFKINAMDPVGFVGFSGFGRYVTSPVMNAVFRRMAEEKKKFYWRGLFRIKTETVYTYIAGERSAVGVRSTGLRAFIGISQEKWTDGWIDAEGRETEIMEDLKWGFYRVFRKILQTYCIPCVPNFKCRFVEYGYIYIYIYMDTKSNYFKEKMYSPF